MFEHKSHPLITRRLFYLRFFRCFLSGLGLVSASLAAGMWGYHFFEALPWLDAFLNASMLLSGMGPLNPPQTVGGKLFAGIYAIYCGLVLVVIAGITFAPVVHRFFHRLHLESKNLD